MNLVHIAGALLLVGAALVFLWPKIATLLTPKPSPVPSPMDPPSWPDSWVPVDPRSVPVDPSEVAYAEAQSAFAKLKDLEAYFTKVGSAEGLEAVCRAGECMFRPPVVMQIKSVQPAE